MKTFVINDYDISTGPYEGNGDDVIDVIDLPSVFDSGNSKKFTTYTKEGHLKPTVSSEPKHTFEHNKNSAEISRDGYLKCKIEDMKKRGKNPSHDAISFS